MKRLFNGGWSFWCGEPDLDVSEAGKHLTEFQKVDLPHDWLIADAKNLYRDGCGFYRNFFSMQPKENKRYSLIFEGVYMDTTIWVNEQQAGEWKYGYSTFEIDLTPFVKAGENEFLVSVNFRSPNSRWYSGAGIGMYGLRKRQRPISGKTGFISIRKPVGKRLGRNRTFYSMRIQRLWEMPGTRCVIPCITKGK